LHQVSVMCSVLRLLAYEFNASCTSNLWHAILQTEGNPKLQLPSNKQ